MLAVVVEPLCGRPVDAIGGPPDLRAELALGIVEPVLAGGEHGVVSVLVDQLQEPGAPQPRRRDQRLGVAAVQRRRARVGPDVLPQLLVSLAAILDPQRRVVVALGPHVDRVHHQPRGHPADVCEVAVRARPRAQAAVVEDRDRHAQIRCVRRPQVRVVVEEHVALVDVVADDRDDPLQVPRNRARRASAWCRFRTARRRRERRSRSPSPRTRG